MGTLRLVILDYPKKQINNLDAQRTLSDVIITKQINFERTDPDYVVMDKHDMIGTHYLIYDTANVHYPKLVFAIRTTFEERARLHKLKTPLQELIPHTNDRCKKMYEDYRHSHANLVDCNSWFVDVHYSKKNSGLRLSDLGYTMVCLHVLRNGFSHIAGCTNERYKASRWLENIGRFERDGHFVHPTVADPHLLVLIEEFNYSYLANVYREHEELFVDLMDLGPEPASNGTIAETAQRHFRDDSDTSPFKLAA